MKLARPGGSRAGRSTALTIYVDKKGRKTYLLQKTTFPSYIKNVRQKKKRTNIEE